MASQTVSIDQFQNLRQWLDNDRKTSAKYCDVSFIVDGQKYPAHRCILKTVSPTFDVKFSLTSKNYAYHETVVKGISKNVFGIMLDLIYSGKVDLEFDYIRETCILYSRDEDD